LPKTERHTLTADIGGTDSRMERSKQVRLSVGSFLYCLFSYSTNSCIISICNYYTYGDPSTSFPQASA
jgi:hypothetical protein